VITAAEGHRSHGFCIPPAACLSVCLSKRKSGTGGKTMESRGKTKPKAKTNAIGAHKRQRTNQVAICGYERVRHKHFYETPHMHADRM